MKLVIAATTRRGETFHGITLSQGQAQEIAKIKNNIGKGRFPEINLQIGNN